MKIQCTVANYSAVYPNPATPDVSKNTRLLQNLFNILNCSAVCFEFLRIDKHGKSSRR